MYKYKIPALPEGTQTHVMKMQYSPQKPGPHTITISVDSDNEIQESNENNNILPFRYDINAAPEIIID